MCEGKHFFNGVGFECWGSGGEKGRVGCQGAGGREWWERDLHVVAY